MEVSQVFEKLKPILDSYLEKKVELDRKIFQEGILPSEIIEECTVRDIKKISKYGEELLKLKSEFVNWVQKNKIINIENNTKDVYFTSKQQKVDNIKGNSLYESVYEERGDLDKSDLEYDYRIPISKLTNETVKQFLKEFEFSGTSHCAHIDEGTLSESFPVVLATKENTRRLISSDRDTMQNVLDDGINTGLRFMCSDCYNRIDKLCCESSIRKEGLGYLADYWHKFDETLLKVVLKENKINVKILQEDVDKSRVAIVFYFPEFNGLLTSKNSNLEKIIEKLKPEILIIKGKKELIIDLLKFNTNLIIFDDSNPSQKYSIFDKNKKVESDVEKCCLEIVQNLEEVSENTRGNEHEKLIGALEKIGRSLGYVPQKEVVSKGNRVDLIWHDREGNVFSALEVETKGNWKKDIISTWEIEPKLAVILTNTKSEKSIKELMKYVLLRNMPHKLLFLNYTTKLGYLLEKQKILRSYDIAKRKEIESEVIEY